jgi:hypothetical protein
MNYAAESRRREGFLGFKSDCENAEPWALRLYDTVFGLDGFALTFGSLLRIQTQKPSGA